MPQATEAEEVPDRRVYDAEPELCRPGHLIVQMLHDLMESWGIAREMARRNLAAQYRESLFGVVLAFCPALVVTAWSTLIQHARIINVDSLEIPYPAFVLLGMMLWMTFLEALQAPIEGLERELHILARARIPAEAVILARLLEVLFHFGVKLVLIVGAVLYFGLPITWYALVAPLLLVCLIALGTGIGLFLAPLNVLYQDISKSLGIVTTFWFFLTPVLFCVPTEGFASIIVRFNPVTPLLSGIRELITLGGVSHPGDLLAAGVGSVVLLLGGWVFFRLSLPVVLDRSNA